MYVSVHWKHLLVYCQKTHLCANKWLLLLCVWFQNIDFDARAPYIPMNGDEDLSLLPPSTESLLTLQNEVDPGWVRRLTDPAHLWGLLTQGISGDYWPRAFMGTIDPAHISGDYWPRAFMGTIDPVHLWGLLTQGIYRDYWPSTSLGTIDPAHLWGQNALYYHSVIGVDIPLLCQVWNVHDCKPHLSSFH